MTRKSASKIKPLKTQRKVERVPLEELFNDAKDGNVLIAETQVKIAERTDNTANIRDFCRKFFGDERYFEEEIENGLQLVNELQDLSIDTYKKILEVIKGWKLEDFTKETVDDMFEDIVYTREDIGDNPRGLCKACLVWLSVRPYADKMLKMHQYIQDEIEMRKQDEVGE